MTRMLRFSLIFFLLAPQASARVLLDRSRLNPVPPPGRSAPLPSRPAWLKIDGTGDSLEETADKIERAAALLSRSATGRALGPTLNAMGGTVRVNHGGSFLVSGSEVSVGPEFLLERTDETAAVLFAHELEHVRQHALGLAGEKARGVRELTAFLVQTRVWVELGASLKEDDLKANWNNSHDMTAALDYPAAAMTVLAYRSGWRADLGDAKVRGYWLSVLKEDAAWRGRWRAKFPQRDSAESARFVLKQALRFQGMKGDVSPWLPDVMESLMATPAGKTVLLPGAPTSADKALLDAHPLAPRLQQGEAGAWGLLRP